MKKFNNILFFLFISAFSSLSYSYCDAPAAWQMGFQDPATPVLEGIVAFHNDLWFFLVIIGTVVFWMIFQCLITFSEKNNPVPSVIIHGTFLEIVWTTVPALILLCIAVPSFALLYSMDELIDPSVTIKAVGHQWYWHYEYSDHVERSNGEDLGNIIFDSYMIPEDDPAFVPGSFRLLEVFHKVKLPVKTHIRLVITAADVLHAWAVPSLGIKLDACPGRLNQASIFIKRPGLYYGQCSEICGVNHAFMPIVVEAMDQYDYADWVLGLSALSEDDRADRFSV